MLRPIVVSFCDDDARTFVGYTDGRRWNGFACPQFTFHEFIRVLDLLVRWHDERAYTVETEHRVTVHGILPSEDYTMTAKLVETTDGPRWLFDCGGAWTFTQIDHAAAPAA